MSEARLLKAGGTLSFNDLYVQRRADSDLPSALLKNEFCFVLAPRQIGKSSLRLRVQDRLRKSGAHCASIDLTLMGSHVTAEQWYLGFVEELAEQLELCDPQDYWRALDAIPAAVRWSRYLRDEVLAKFSGQVVIFIDEIDAILGLPFSHDEFFAAIRGLYNRRADDKQFERLTFCLLGVAAPEDLIANPLRTPFNVPVRHIALEDFSRSEMDAFLPALHPMGDMAQNFLDSVYEWAHGHPYMTQRILEGLLTQPPSQQTPAAMTKAMVEVTFLHRGRNYDSNLAYAEKAFQRRGPSPRTMQMLDLYARLLFHEHIVAAGTDSVQLALRLTGVAAEQFERNEVLLRVRNRIFEKVFDAAWVKAVRTENFQLVGDHHPTRASMAVIPRERRFDLTAVYEAEQAQIFNWLKQQANLAVASVDASEQSLTGKADSTVAELSVIYKPAHRLSADLLHDATMGILSQQVPRVTLLNSLSVAPWLLFAAFIMYNMLMLWHVGEFNISPIFISLVLQISIFILGSSLGEIFTNKWIRSLPASWGMPSVYTSPALIWFKCISGAVSVACMYYVMIRSESDNLIFSLGGLSGIVLMILLWSLSGFYRHKYESLRHLMYLVQCEIANRLHISNIELYRAYFMNQTAVLKGQLNAIIDHSR